MTTIDDILAMARPAEKTVELCLAGDLQAKFEDLERDLARAKSVDSDPGAKLGSAGAARRIAEEMEQVRAQMRDRTVVFRLRAITHREWVDLTRAHPARPEDPADFNPETFGVALLAACCINPQLDVGAAGRLVDALTAGQWERLFAACWQVCRGTVEVPFSVAASATLATEPK